MKRWILGFVALILVLFVSGVVYLYSFGGLKQYIRAVRVINNMPDEDKKLAREDFNGTDQKGVERGILAGSWIGKVWVWESTGLKSYTVDEYSIYSIFDGCSESVRDRIKEGEANVIEQILFTDIEQWREEAQVGDYVVVYPAGPGQGGTEGNLREIYAYNFWLFMHTGIDRQCEK